MLWAKWRYFWPPTTTVTSTALNCSLTAASPNTKSTKHPRDSIPFIMKTYTDKVVPANEAVSGAGKVTERAFSQMMSLLISILTKIGLLKEDLDYHLVRASMVIIFLFFGYQKWFAYEAQGLIPFINNGPLISWMYLVFGIQG